jgi:hypothetical protein
MATMNSYDPARARASGVPSASSLRARPARPRDAPRHMFSEAAWQQHKQLLQWQLRHETKQEWEARRRDENQRMRRHPKRPAPSVDHEASMAKYRQRLRATNASEFAALPPRFVLSCFGGAKRPISRLEDAAGGGAPEHAIVLWEELVSRGKAPAGIVPHNARWERTPSGARMKVFVHPVAAGVARLYLGRKMTMEGNYPHALAFCNADRVYNVRRRTTTSAKTTPPRRRARAKRRRVRAPSDANSIGGGGRGTPGGGVDGAPSPASPVTPRTPPTPQGELHLDMHAPGDAWVLTEDETDDAETMGFVVRAKTPQRHAVRNTSARVGTAGAGAT